MRISFLFHLILFLCLHSAFAQEEIRGKIQDKHTGEILENVLIQHLRLNKHNHSDWEGNFRLKQTQPGDSLRINHLGYEEKLLIIEPQRKDYLIQLSPAPLQLQQIEIRPQKNTLSEIAQIDIALNPVRSSQEILQKVPGLFIAQHAGGGKAEQIFLRGFDIDHGTDIQISADGLPVNMVSHAHGQGYADLHFLIPETIEKIDFGKGPYYTDKGNFSTAGYVDFQTFDKISESQLKLEVGRFDTRRIMGIFNLLPQQQNSHAYIASEYLTSAGPFESPQDFKRLNLFGKYLSQIGNHQLKFQASTFSSSWDASGQIPQRAIDSGQIGRFGAIDDTEGGYTSRHNVSLSLRSLQSPKQFLETQIWFSQYNFELYSNFTFFLNDPERGDQIRQKENRNLFGFNTNLHRFFELGSWQGKWKTGISLRKDNSLNNELSHTANRRETLERRSYHNIFEENTAIYSEISLNNGNWLFNPGLRLDYFNFSAQNLLVEAYEKEQLKQAILSPKLNLIFSPNPHWQFYFKSGKSFHSNDSRVSVTQRREILPAAYGSDLGAIWQAIPGLYLDLAVWGLYSEQEFVYVGDEGVVEPSGKSLRKGIDLGIRWQVSPRIYTDVNLNYAHARSLDEEAGNDRIPLAPSLTSTGGITAQLGIGFSSSLRYRYLADRAANEDNSLTAEGYFINDLMLAYDQKSWGFQLSVENLFNQEWREAQFETESRLFEEAEPVTEIHFTPGTPFFLKAGVVYRF